MSASPEADTGGAVTVTLPPASPDQTLETPETPKSPTNAEFLTAIFLGLQGDERPMVVRVNGAINDKTKWPPGRAWAPGTDAPWLADAANWYFTLSVYHHVDGEYRRRKASFSRAYGVMLDDLGSKAAPLNRLDALPPSYVVETSPGNYQAGYLFAEPCADLARVEALQDALVASGLCDPGAKGPSARIGRLPVGVNGKYAPPPPCRLVSFNPERRYTIEQIVEGLELLLPAKPDRSTKAKPAGAGQQSTKPAPAAEDDDTAPVHVPRPAENPVLAALRQRGLYKKMLEPGKHDITCPWVHEHTGQVDHGSAYFEPSQLYPIGGYKCQHSHGDAKRISALLEFLDLSTGEAKCKPTIYVRGGELHSIVDAAERELAAGGRHYQRGGLIVSIVADPATGDSVIKPTSRSGLTRALSILVEWLAYSKSADDWVPIDPPPVHVNVLHDSELYPHLPVLRSIARQPYLRGDDSLVTVSGFDAASGMYGAFDARRFTVPAKPSQADAAAALRELRGLLSEFAFARAHDEAAALAMFLTAVIRPTLPAAPMFHIKAPVIASGKSYLSRIGAAFASSAPSSAHSFPDTEEECSKLLLAALLEGPAVVTFDNLNADLIAHKSLCSALTETHLTGRILGLSKTATVSTATLFISSGNNVDPVRDMARRVVTINLDPGCETPAERKFKNDPEALIRSRREHFVSLALTVVRAYIEAGYPALDLKPLNSYGVWTRLVRAPLAWLGLPDAATTVFESMATDPDRETLGQLLVAWRAAFGSTPTAVRTAVERAVGPFGVSTSELSEVLREIAEDHGSINRKRLGRWIARHQGRIVNGMKFERTAPSGGSEQWKVVSGVTGVRSGQAAERFRPAAEVFA